MKIGNVTINGYAALAPMAGVADRAFRELCKEQGASFTVGELTSAKGIVLGSQKSKAFLAVFPAERPMAPQLFGCDPDIMAKAAIEALPYQPDFIDINMGCPAPKVIASGGGSALLNNIPLAAAIVTAVKNAVPVPVTVKMRIGWDRSHIVATELAKAVEAAGADAITVHGRTRDQMYAPSADWQTIAKVKQTVSIPVIGNGDVYTPKDAAHLYETTGCDMIMVGRGAMGAPWIFQQINAYMQNKTILPPPPLAQRMEILLEQCNHMCRYKDPHLALLQLRKHTAWYIKGLPGAAAFRQQCNDLTTVDDVKVLIDAVLTSCQNYE